jgi:aspartate/glutamate racemase
LRVRRLGVIGGLGPESTIDYYKALVEIWRRERPDGSYPPLNRQPRCAEGDRPRHRGRHARTDGVPRRVRAASRARRRRSPIDAVILGGTELPLILREPEYGGIALLDTTRIHVEAAVREMLGG